MFNTQLTKDPHSKNEHNFIWTKIKLNSVKNENKSDIYIQAFVEYGSPIHIQSVFQLKNMDKGKTLAFTSSLFFK